MYLKSYNAYILKLFFFTFRGLGTIYWLCDHHHISSAFLYVAKKIDHYNEFTNKECNRHNLSNIELFCITRTKQNEYLSKHKIASEDASPKTGKRWLKGRGKKCSQYVSVVRSMGWLAAVKDTLALSEGAL